MEDDFQFVDVESNETNKDLKAVREELQKLAEARSLKHNEVQSLRKEMNECRVGIDSMREKLEEMKEEKDKMQEEMKSLETKNEKLLVEIGTLKDQLLKVKKGVSVSNTASHSCEDEISESRENGIKKDNAKLKLSLKELEASQYYACKVCDTKIALECDITNRSYQVGQGEFTEKKRGFLFSNAVNLTLGPIKTESFTTGSYDIAWVSCTKCGESLGWKYLTSTNESNASKLGKYCLARYSLCSPQERSEK